MEKKGKSASDLINIFALVVAVMGILLTIMFGGSIFKSSLSLWSLFVMLAPTILITWLICLWAKAVEVTETTNQYLAMLVDKTLDVKEDPS